MMSAPLRSGFASVEGAGLLLGYWLVVWFGFLWFGLMFVFQEGFVYSKMPA